MNVKINHEKSKSIDLVGENKDKNTKEKQIKAIIKATKLCTQYVTLYYKFMRMRLKNSFLTQPLLMIYLSSLQPPNTIHSVLKCSVYIFPYKNNTKS